MLSVPQKEQLDSIMSLVDINKLDSVYDRGENDGDGYMLDISNDSLRKHVFVHISSPLSELEALKAFFFKLRAGFLPAEHPPIFLITPAKMQGKSKIFILNDSNEDKYYLSDSMNSYFEQAYIGEFPVIAIDGIVYNFKKQSDTVVIPVFKNEITGLIFLGRKSSSFIYGDSGNTGAIVINTDRWQNIKALAMRVCHDPWRRGKTIRR